MFLVNHIKSTAAQPRSHVLEALGKEGRSKAETFLLTCPVHAPTPLHALPSFAQVHGIASLHVKDEGQRMGLKSFKALGGAYAVAMLVLLEAGKRLGRALNPIDLQLPEVRAVAATMTVTCATDGNHGRSVAAGARMAGCKAVILMHGGVSNARVAAITGFGAEVIRVAGSYDDSVVEAARLARANGWTVVSDTSYDGYEDIPLTVMQGYAVMAGEAFDALPQPPTHIFIQAGVGGVAAAVAAHALDVFGASAPRIIVVEPERAACLFASAKAGKLTTAPHDSATIMGMLECYEPSRLAWEVLAPLAEGFVTLPEDAAIEAMNLLAKPLPGDPPIVAGESGCAGFAGMTACLRDDTARLALKLDHSSRVLIVVSEGATDPESYKHHVGHGPEEISK